MKYPSSNRNSMEYYSFVLAILAILLALIGLSGWVFNVFILKSFLSNGVTMKVNTALMILGGGVSLILLNNRKTKISSALLILILVFSIAIIVEYAANINLNIDQFLFKDKDTNPLLGVPGRTSLLTCIAVILMAIAMLMVVNKRYYMSQVTAILLFLLIYTALLGHLFGVTGFYLQGRYSGIAFHTAFCLLLIDMGILFYQAQYGWMKFFMQHITGKRGLVYLFSYLLCAAPLLVAFYLVFINHDQASPASGIIVMIVISAVISIPLSYIIMRRISEMDNDLIKSNQRLEIALKAAKLGSYDLDLETMALNGNSQFKTNLGLPNEMNLSFADLVNLALPVYREQLWEQLKLAMTNHDVFHAEYEVQLPDNSLRWISMFGQPDYDTEGNPLSVVGVARDISGQKEIEKKKDAFIGVVSHELKTPLTSLKAYVQILNKRAAAGGDAFITNALEKVELQVNKMNSMITAFLDVARLESGNTYLEKSKFSIRELILEIIEEHAFISGSPANYKNSEDIIITADREKIAHVITNLVSNAIKYSAPGEPVTVNSKLAGDKLTVSVKDQGMGILQSDLKNIFQRFYRVTSDETKQISGFGIGLYLSAEIIKQHNGKIWAESVKDHGSVFHFTLPV